MFGVADGEAARKALARSRSSRFGSSAAGRLIQVTMAYRDNAQEIGSAHVTVCGGAPAGSV
jgi:hypothetical protein